MKHKVKKWLVIAIMLLAFCYVGIYVFEQSKDSKTDSRITLSDGRQLAYRVVNEGAERVIYFVHGAPADASSWSNVESVLPNEGYTFVFIDRLGYGNSDRSYELSLEEHAKSIIELKRNRRDLSPTVVGHSYGGPVALSVAAHFPTEIAGIVLVAGACDPYMEDSIWFRKLVNRISFLIPDSWEHSNRELLALTQENRDLMDQVSDVVCPVSVLHGTWDPVCPFEGTIEYFKANLSNARLKVTPLEKRGHNLHLSHPELVAELAIEIVGTRGAHNLTPSVFDE